MFNPYTLFYSDGYKLGHKRMLAPNTDFLYGTMIPRSLRHAPKGIKKIVVAGQQFAWKWINDQFEENFFKRPIGEADEFTQAISLYLGQEYNADHFKELHKLGYLPIRVKSLPEGVETNIGIPHMTFVNTVKGFAWLTLYLETILSAAVWKMSTSATIALKFRRNVNEWVKRTDIESLAMTDYMCHDFSSRGLDPFTMIASGLGHAISHRGSDTLAVIPAAWYYYGEPKNEVVINSVNASEHSVSTTKIFTVGEKQMIIDWLKEFPTGVLSIVADTFNIWKFIEYLKEPEIKKLIDERDGKLVVRPDCYSDDTNIMTKDGWKLFKDLDRDKDLVAQVLDDGSYEFVKPLKYVDEYYKGEMIKYKDFHGKIDLLVTPNHRMIYKNSKDKFKVQEAENCNFYWGKNILRSASAKDFGKKLSPMEALKIAFQSDGSYHTKSNNIRFHFTKQRKIDRLKEILKRAEIPYKTYDIKSGGIEFNIQIDAKLFQKDLEWVNISDLCKNWSQEFIEELSYWDGTRRHDKRFKFDTTTESVIKVVEYVAMAAGYGVLIKRTEDNRKEHFSDVFTAHILLDNKLGGQSIKKEVVEYEGNIVCVQVPTGRIVVNRNGGQVVCGNSGDPVDIVSGVNTRKDFTGIRGDGISCEFEKFNETPVIQQYTKEEQKGVVELLYEIFGGTKNKQGNIVLDPHIGVIYGDAITLDRQVQIYERLEAKGFATTNIFIGVGSYSYGGGVTRDTFGFAIKGSWFSINGEGFNIFKDPITDRGSKKSLKGMVAVHKDQNGEYFVKTECTKEEENQGELKVIFEDGKHLNQVTFKEIRQRIGMIS